MVPIQTMRRAFTHRSPHGDSQDEGFCGPENTYVIGMLNLPTHQPHGDMVLLAGSDMLVPYWRVAH